MREAPLVQVDELVEAVNAVLCRLSFMQGGRTGRLNPRTHQPEQEPIYVGSGNTN